jgi:hypothetical protein
MQNVIDDCLKIGEEISNANDLINEMTNTMLSPHELFKVFMIDEQGKWWFMEEKLTEPEIVEAMKASKKTYEHRKFVITRERKTVEILNYDDYYGTDEIMEEQIEMEK